MVSVVQGKMIFHFEACESKIPWDATLPSDKLPKLWTRWKSSVSTKRNLIAYKEPIDALESHSFGEASGHGVAALVYAVVSEASGITHTVSLLTSLDYQSEVIPSRSAITITIVMLQALSEYLHES